MDKNRLAHIHSEVSKLLQWWGKDSHWKRDNYLCFDTLAAQSLLRRCIPTPKGDALLRKIKKIVDKRGKDTVQAGCEFVQAGICPNLVRWIDEWVGEINLQSCWAHSNLDTSELLEEIDNLELFLVSAKEVDCSAAKEIEPQINETVEHFSNHPSLFCGALDFFQAWKNTIRPDLHEAYPELERTIDKFYPVFPFLEKKR